MNMIRTLIVDDEAPARQWLRSLCAKHSDVEVVGESSNVPQAAQKLRAGAIDLLLLDIQLGPQTGFQVLENLPAGSLPLVVFVTAYDQYAVRAFEKNAVDYLLKPVRDERFRATLERVRTQLQGGLTGEIRAAIHAALGPLERAFHDQQTMSTPERLIAQRGDAFHVIDPSDVEVLEASGNYVLVHVAGAGEPYSTRSTLQSFEELVDPANFLRISRSTIVNLAHVARIERDADSAFCFVARSGRRLSVGRSYRRRIADFVRASGRVQVAP